VSALTQYQEPKEVSLAVFWGSFLVKVVRSRQVVPGERRGYSLAVRGRAATAPTGRNPLCPAMSEPEIET